MAELSFEDFVFHEKEHALKVDFLRLFYFEIEKDSLKKIGKYETKENTLIFPEVKQEKAEKFFSRLLNKGFSELKSKITNSPAIYIHKNSNIPLIGSLSFGIIDKGTDMLEIKPITGCNISCIFCSVDEGPCTKKSLDIVIEKDYLIQETKKLLDYKKQPVHIYINPHGEPLLYKDIVELVKELKQLEYVNAVSIITNATLLTEELADKLIEAGLDEFNVSISSIDEKKAKELSGSPSYDIKKIKRLLEKIKDKIKIIISPVFMDKINEKDIEDLVTYCKKNDFELLIQNFLLNRRGRKPTKELPFERFYERLKELEKKHNIELIKQGTIKKTKPLPKPFIKGDTIEANIISEGRYKDETLATSKDRLITIKGMTTKNKAKITLTKDRYNIFYGILV